MRVESNGFELVVERLIGAPPAVVWKVWTEQTEAWWAPKPWTTRIIEQDLRPGGRSAMIMSGPDGQASPMEGVFLEVIAQQSIVFTNAFKTGWIPQAPFMLGFFSFGRRQPRSQACRHWS